MKRLKTAILFFAVLSVALQTVAQGKISCEVSGFYGSILKHNKHLENLVQGAPIGVSLSVAWQTDGSQAWQQYWNFPVVGASLTWLNLSNPTMLGHAFAAYPYLQLPIFRTRFASLYARPGAGLSVVTKYYGNTPHDPNALSLNGVKDGANGAIGSALNVFFALGAKLEIPVVYGFSITGEGAWNHISNGMTVAPNSGINMFGAYAGIKYTPSYKGFALPEKRALPNLPRRFSVEIMLSGGARELYYRDNKRYAIAALGVALYRPLSNRYKTGIGLDAYYDGVFGAVNTPENPQTAKTTYFLRTYVSSDKMANKFRIGTSWHNDFVFGRFTAGFHFGVYLFDPVKNLEPYSEVQNNGGKPLKKGIFYKYDIDKADGWFYSTVQAKYDITRNFFAAIALKTHLQKAEFIEWGLGVKF